MSLFITKEIQGMAKMALQGRWPGVLMQDGSTYATDGFSAIAHKLHVGGNEPLGSNVYPSEILAKAPKETRASVAEIQSAGEGYLITSQGQETHCEYRGYAKDLVPSDIPGTVRRTVQAERLTTLRVDGTRLANLLKAMTLGKNETVTIDLTEKGLVIHAEKTLGVLAPIIIEYRIPQGNENDDDGESSGDSERTP